MLALLLTCVQDAAPSKEYRWEGAVRDAFTDEPLAGVAFEFWSESTGGEPELVASALSAADGRCAQLVTPGRVEKVRLRKSGYRSTLGTLTDEEFRLFPANEPFELFVLDLEGRPIQGATVQLRQTCRHAVPTSRAVSDARGYVSLHDLPPFWDDGELEILAPGYGALGELETADLAPRANVYLPRRPGLALLLLQAGGQPAAPGTCRYDGDDGGYPLVLDAEGRTAIPSLFDDHTGAVSLGDFSLDLPPAGEETCLRFENLGGVERAARLWLELASQGELPAGLRVSLLHEQGWLADGLGEHALPAGALRVVLGAPFSGFEPELTRLTLSAGDARMLTLTPRPEPELSIELPEGAWRVHVQAGDDSVTRFTDGKGALRVHVPAGRALVVLAQGEDVRRARLGPDAFGVDGGRGGGILRLDLRAPESRIEPPRHPGEPLELRFAMRSQADRRIDVRAVLRTQGPTREDEDPSPGGVLFHVPANARWEARFAAEGHVTLWRSGLADGTGALFAQLALPPAEDD
jgi:hypothetical protein